MTRRRVWPSESRPALFDPGEDELHIVGTELLWNFANAGVVQPHHLARKPDRSFLVGNARTCVDHWAGAVAVGSEGEFEAAGPVREPADVSGAGHDASLRIEEVSYETDGSSFTLVDERYTIPMVGEFNVRNAAMAVAGGIFAGLRPDEIRSGFASFQGIARRQQLCGEVRGVRVIDDFAHHPTSIRLAVQALRQRYPDARLWIIFEPRSNTTRRNIFQSELADALASADRAVVPAIADPEKFAEEERLDPEQLVRDIAAGGGQGVYLPTVEEIAGHVAAEAEAGDVVAILSNGGFGGLHGILLERLGDAATGR